MKTCGKIRVGFSTFHNKFFREITFDKKVKNS